MANNKPKVNPKDVYSGAPYNFITQRKPLSREEKELPAQNKLIHNGMAPAASAEPDKELKNLYSGEFHYTVEALTDIFVGGSDGKEFYQNADGTISIPGSTIRGLVRNNMKILGIGELAEDVDDYRLMYRVVAGGEKKKLGDEYKDILGIVSEKKANGKQISICKNVKAGFLKYDGKDYWIIMPNEEDKKRENYYILREPDVIRNLLDKKDSTDYPFFARNRNYLMANSRRWPYKKSTKRGLEVKDPNHNYTVGCYKVSFKIENGSVTAVDFPEKLSGKNCFEGYLVNSGYMNNKKAHYLIKAPISEDTSISDSKQCFKLSSECINDYKKDYEARKNQLGPTSNSAPAHLKGVYQKHFSLPQDSTIKPVFYISKSSKRKDAETKVTSDAQDVYLGFTPYLRLFFGHSIAEGIISKIDKPNHCDYAQAILGYSKEDASRKSRVAFGDAALCLNAKETSDSYLGKNVSGVLGSPKASSYMDYVVQQSKNRKDRLSYNDPSFELRGFKQYWLHEKAMLPETKPQNDTQSDLTKDSVKSSFTPISTEKKPKFSGIIRFKNLRADELGLLLWCFCLEKDWQQNIGKAKPYGYGRIKISIDQLRLYDFAKLYRSDSLDFSPWTEFNQPGIDAELKKWIDCYKNEAAKILNMKNIMDVESIQQFGFMKNSKLMPEEESIRYMELSHEYTVGNETVDCNEFTSRGVALPYPEDIIR